jgi:general secretion pathway protein I
MPAGDIRRDARGREAGGRGAFTLVEVLLALALFAMAVVVLAASYINVLNALESVKVDQALEQELALVRSRVLQEPDLDEIEKGGEVPTPTHGVARWEAQVSPTAVADLFRVDVRVELEGSGEETAPRTVDQTLYLLRADWSEPVERDELRAETRKRLDEIKRFRPL